MEAGTAACLVHSRSTQFEGSMRGGKGRHCRVPPLLGSSNVEPSPGASRVLGTGSAKGCADTRQIGCRDSMGFLPKVLMWLLESIAQGTLGWGMWARAPVLGLGTVLLICGF